MHGENRQRETDSDDDRVARLVTRLQDLLVEEISAVDRAANKRRFLVIKTEGDEMPTGEEVFETGDGTMTTDAFGAVEAAAGANDDAGNAAATGDTIDGTDKATPAPVKAAVVKMLEESGNRLDSLITKLKETDGDATPPLIGEGRSIVTVLRGVSSKYPSPKAKSDDAEPASDDEQISKVAAGAAAAKLASARGKLSSLITKVKGLPEGEGALPADVNKAIDEIAMMIEEGLGVAKSASKQEGEDEDMNAPPTDVRSSLVEAAKLLHVALGKLAAGKPCDEESLRMIAKARDVCTAAAKTKSRKSDDAGASEPAQGEPASDREQTEKAGTKQLSRARREKFKGALDALIKLFEEMIPEAERKSMWPTRKAATPEPEPVHKSDEPDPEIVELRKTVDAQNARIAKLQGLVKDHVDEPGDTNLATVSKGDDNDNGTSRTVWEHDLNEPEADAW